MDNTLIYKILATLMVLEPETEMAKMVVEFAERPSNEDLEACWQNAKTVARINQAKDELYRWELEHQGVINEMAEAMAEYFDKRA
jgi:hypothetical protein